MSNAIAASGGILTRWRFAIVLAASLLLVVGHPLATDLLDDQGAFDAGVSLLIMSVIVLVFEERRRRIIAVALGLTALVGLWSSYAFPDGANVAFVASSYLLTAGFFSFALFGIVRTILVGQVSHDAILGAVCGYLLMGIIWSLLYAAVETTAPGSFAAAGRDGDAPLTRGTLSYFSFVTLSTVGYGDVTPVTPAARTLAWSEALAGQFYLAVLVAGLVGFIVSQRPPRTFEDRTGDADDRRRS